MTKMVRLDKKQHQGYNLERNFPFSFCKKDTLCPIILAEVPHIVQQAPIVFVKKNKNTFGVFMLQGYFDQTNSFCSDSGAWLGSYIPAQYRQYPFSLMTPETKEKNAEIKSIVCFDQSSNLVTKKISKHSVPLFDEQGETTEHIKNVMNFLSKVEGSRTNTQEIVNALDKKSLFQPWDLKVKDKEKDKEIKVNGLWTINKTTLANLPSHDLFELHQLKALELIYGHFFSLAKVQDLASIPNKKFENNAGTSLKDRAINKQKETTDKELDSLVKNLLDGD